MMTIKLAMIATLALSLAIFTTQRDALALPPPGDEPDPCYIDCFEECTLDGTSNDVCHAECVAACHAGPGGGGGYVCTMKDTSADRTACEAGCTSWYLACTGIAWATGAYYLIPGCFAALVEMVQTCPPAQTCV